MAERLAVRIIQIGAIAAVLVALPDTAFDLDRFLVPKELALHLTAVIAGILALGAIRRSTFNRVDLLLILFLALSVVSAIFATNHWLAMRAVAVSASGILLFWTARALRDAGLGERLLNGLALAVVVAAVTSLLQAYGLRIDLFALNRSPGGTLGNRNFVAHVAAIGLPLCMLAALRGRKLGYLAVAIVMAALVLSRSRAGWLAFAVMFVIFVFSSRAWLRLGGVILFAAAGVAAALVIPNTLHWRGENPYLQSVRGVANYEEGSGRGRLVQYEHSARMALFHPIFGVGPGNWPVRYAEYAARNDPSLSDSEPGMTFNPWPSSDWIALVSERGLAAAVLLALALISIALSAFKSEDRLPGAALLATLAAAVVAGLFDAVLLLAVPTLIVWSASGALMPASLAVRRWPLAVYFLALALSLIGVVRSAAQVAAMELYVNGSFRQAARIDPGNYRVQMRLGGCAHAKAAHALFPNASAARAASRGCR